mmetsp:Transcript_30206/g.44112  ORF Transcript_30206/g.44112 Transcript_30206/m.44112 type:complete len:114 (+) Transcript_30206:1559-1900(+)
MVQQLRQATTTTTIYRIGAFSLYRVHREELLSIRSVLCSKSRALKKPAVRRPSRSTTTTFSKRMRWRWCDGILGCAYTRHSSSSSYSLRCRRHPDSHHTTVSLEQQVQYSSSF